MYRMLLLTYSEITEISLCVLCAWSGSLFSHLRLIKIRWAKNPPEKLNQSVEVFRSFKEESHVFLWCFW